MGTLLSKASILSSLQTAKQSKREEKPMRGSVLAVGESLSAEWHELRGVDMLLDSWCLINGKVKCGKGDWARTCWYDLGEGAYLDFRVSSIQLIFPNGYPGQKHDTWVRDRWEEAGRLPKARSWQQMQLLGPKGPVATWWKQEQMRGVGSSLLRCIPPLATTGFFLKPRTS